MTFRIILLNILLLILIQNQAAAVQNERTEFNLRKKNNKNTTLYLAQDKEKKKCYFIESAAKFLLILKLETKLKIISGSYLTDINGLNKSLILESNDGDLCQIESLKIKGYGFQILCFDSQNQKTYQAHFDPVSYYYYISYNQYNNLQTFKQNLQTMSVTVQDISSFLTGERLDSCN